MSALTPAETPEEPADRLAGAGALARAAAVDEALVQAPDLPPAETVGEHQGTEPEDGALTHFYAAHLPGYRGWRWAVTVAAADPDAPVTVSEVALLPGADALVSPAWVPWQDRVRPGDLGPGDLLPRRPDDDRLAPAYLASDDPAVEEVAVELGLGRREVLSRDGRTDAADRWHGGPHGARADAARQAPGACGTCGFYLPLAGSLAAAFGVCGNEYSPADGAVVAVEFGCGAHSDVDPDTGPNVPVAALVYDDGVDLEVRGPVTEPAGS